MTVIYIELIWFMACIAYIGFKFVKAEYDRDIYRCIHYGVLAVLVTMLYTASIR
ncbi:MAG: hypothetical protein IJN43_13800 [Ruminococcus sp.]|nr:hypothetical protein [Ruminococcus sp.]